MNKIRKLIQTLFHQHYRFGFGRKVCFRTQLIGGVKLGQNVRIKNSRLSGDIDIGYGCKIIEVNLSGKIKIGRHTSISGPNSSITQLINPVNIGSYCSIAKGLTIQEYEHDSSRPSTYFFGQNIFGLDLTSDVISKGSVCIGNDVWIGTNVIILSGVSIGDGSIVAAGAVVTSDVEPYSIVGGVPAKKIKNRFSSNVIKELLKNPWWDWSDSEIKRNQDYFLNSISDE